MTRTPDISSKNVIVEWAQRKAFLRDEQHAAYLTDHLARIGYRGDDHPVSRAVSEVFEAAGEPDLLFWRGELVFEPDALDRLANRAGIPAPASRVGYVDRHGRHHLPFDSVVPLAEHLGLLQVWLTSVMWGDALRKDGSHAQEIPAEVQA